MKLRLLILLMITSTLTSSCVNGGSPRTSALSDDERCAKDAIDRNREMRAIAADAAREAVKSATPTTDTRSRPATPQVTESQERTARYPAKRGGYTGARVCGVVGCDPCHALSDDLHALAARSNWSVGEGPNFHWWVTFDTFPGQTAAVTEAYPTIVFFRDGVEYSRHVGYDLRRRRQILAELIAEHPAIKFRGGR